MDRQGLRELSGEEHAIASGMQAGTAFAMRLPRRVPQGYRLVRSDPVPGCTDLATFVFADRAGRSFTLSQRRAWLPLAEELAIARVPVTRIAFGGHAFHVVHGVHGGEPIDHAFWPDTRRSMTFEADGCVLDLREVIGRGPGLCAMLRMARDLVGDRAPADAPRGAAILARSASLAHTTGRD